MTERPTIAMQQTAQQGATSSTADSLSEQQEKDAFRHVRRLRGFYMHLIQYVVATLALLAINLAPSPRYMWVFWVMGG